MLIVKDSQLAILSQKSLLAFINKMVDFVVVNFKLNEDKETLKKEITSIIEEAEVYGFYEEVTTEQYIFLKWEYPEFKKYPLHHEIMEILTFPGRVPAKKIDELILLFENRKNKTTNA
jgi:hypothetical protein